MGVRKELYAQSSPTQTAISADHQQSVKVVLRVQYAVYQLILTIQPVKNKSWCWYDGKNFKGLSCDT